MRPAALLSAFCLTVFAPAAQAVAQTPPEALVWMVLNDINITGLDRDMPMNRPPIVSEVPEGMIHAVDLSSDGQVDWLIDYSKAGLSQFCGTGGCRLVLYVSDDDGEYRRAFDNQVLAFDISRRVGRQRLEAQVHHGACVPDDWDCRYAWAWNPTTGRLLLIPTDAGRTLLDNGGYPAIAQDADGAEPMEPASIRMTLAASRILCPAEDLSLEGQLRQATAAALPDLNGDGKDDWLVQQPIPCDGDSAPDSELHISQVNGDPIQAMTVDSAKTLAIDIGQAPALLVLDKVPMRWEPARRSFVPTE